MSSINKLSSTYFKNQIFTMWFCSIIGLLCQGLSLKSLTCTCLLHYTRIIHLTYLIFLQI